MNGSWYCDAETGLSASQVVAAVEGASSLNLPSGTQAGGSQVLTTGSTVSWNQLDASTVPSGLSDGDDVLSESDVETMVTNDAIDLATSSTVNGEMIITTPPACPDIKFFPMMPPVDCGTASTFQTSLTKMEMES